MMCVVIVMNQVMLMGLKVKLFSVICVRDDFMLHLRMLISSKDYKLFFSLAKSIPNMVYYCKHCKCQSRIKCIVAKFIKSSVTESAQISDGFKDIIRGMDKSMSDLTVQVSKCIEDLGSKIENLLSNQTGL